MYQFFKDEDVVLAKLGGPKQLRSLLHMAGNAKRRIDDDLVRFTHEHVYPYIPTAHLSSEALYWDYVIGFTWDCPDSPVGLCVYDNHADRMHDWCVFCGDPEERK